MRPIVRGAPRARFSKFKESYHRPKSKDIEFFGFSLLVQVHKVLQAVLGENGLGLPSLAYTITPPPPALFKRVGGGLGWIVDDLFETIPLL